MQIGLSDKTKLHQSLLETGMRGEHYMAISYNINIRYKGQNGSARKFVEEMGSTGTADAVRAEAGNLRYEYYIPMNDSETVLLIDSWES